MTLASTAFSHLIEPWGTSPEASKSDGAGGQQMEIGEVTGVTTIKVQGQGCAGAGAQVALRKGGVLLWTTVGQVTPGFEEIGCAGNGDRVQRRSDSARSGGSFVSRATGLAVTGGTLDVRALDGPQSSYGRLVRRPE